MKKVACALKRASTFTTSAVNGEGPSSNVRAIAFADAPAETTTSLTGTAESTVVAARHGLRPVGDGRVPTSSGGSPKAFACAETSAT